jgi:hypothetical protein
MHRADVEQRSIFALYGQLVVLQASRPCSTEHDLGDFVRKLTLVDHHHNLT